MAILSQLYTTRWVLAGLCIALYAALKYKTYKRLSHFKGPFGAGWWEVWHIRAILSLRSHEKYREVTDKYGE